MDIPLAIVFLAGFLFSRDPADSIHSCVHTEAEFLDVIGTKVFCSGRHMIKTFPSLSCLTAEKRFMLFKGPGFFKKVIKIAERQRIIRPID
jgi:hypothetical protein